MLSHASEVSRDDLYGVVTPDPTDTWKLVPHYEVVNTLTDRAAARGLVVKNERFALLDGTVYGANGVQTRLPGARLSPAVAVGGWIPVDLIVLTLIGIFGQSHSHHQFSFMTFVIKLRISSGMKGFWMNPRTPSSSTD